MSFLISLAFDDALASMIYKKLYEYGYKNPHIYFVILNPSLYYKEGKSLNEIPNLEGCSASGKR